jgi:hypothetical protein
MDESRFVHREMIIVRERIVPEAACSRVAISDRFVVSQAPQILEAARRLDVLCRRHAWKTGGAATIDSGLILVEQPIVAGVAASRIADTVGGTKDRLTQQAV